MKLLRIILALFLIVHPVWANVGTDTSASDFPGSGFNNTTMSVSITVSGANSNRALVAFVSIYADGVVTGCTFNTTENFSQEAAGVESSSFFADTYIFVLTNPTATTANVTCTSDTSDTWWGLTALSLYDVDQTTPVSDTDSAASTPEAQSCSFSLSGEAGDMGIVSVSAGHLDTNQGVSDMGWNTGDTEISDGQVNTDTTNDIRGGSAYEIATGSSVTVGADWSSFSSEDTPYGCAAVLINEVAASGYGEVYYNQQQQVN